MTPRAPVAESALEILVAEDSTTQAEQLRHLLEQHGYRVTTVNDGRPALALLGQHHPALILSDINMPKMNGYELCQHIKEDERLRDIPVILLTSLSNAADVLEGLACGADSFITKPYSDSYLLERVERTLLETPAPRISGAALEIEIPIPGQNRVITADPRRMVSLLTSTYEAAIYRNTELVQTQDALRTLNEHLEDLVEQRTAVLLAEIAEREQAERQIRYLVGVLENVSDGIVSTDLNGRVQSWNLGAEAKFQLWTRPFRVGTWALRPCSAIRRRRLLASSTFRWSPMTIWISVRPTPWLRWLIRLTGEAKCVPAARMAA